MLIGVADRTESSSLSKFSHPKHYNVLITTKFQRRMYSRTTTNEMKINETGRWGCYMYVRLVYM